MESKLKLYNRMMSSLRELSHDFVGESSEAIQKRVLLMEEFRVSLRIGLYAPMPGEVLTDKIFIEANRHRKEVYFPMVDEAAGALAFCRVADLEELKPGYAGILEPSICHSRLRHLNALDVVIVPGIAFDLHGGRMGYGKGYYDDCLLGYRGKRVALAFDFQIVPELPMGVRGRKVDWIVTEKRVIRCQ
jgi:5-formyltetrahydrofolate cyclo-ligase